VEVSNVLVAGVLDAKCTSGNPVPDSDGSTEITNKRLMSKIKHYSMYLMKCIFNMV